VGLQEFDGVNPVVGFQLQPDRATVLFKVSATDCPLQIAGLAGVIFKEGTGFTVMVIVADDEQLPAVPVTVYVVVTIGDTTTELPTIPPGCQTYAEAPPP
jgi:hypothetical protein